MAFQPVKEYFEKEKLAHRIQLFDHNTASVEEAAELVGTELGSIAKSIVFDMGDHLIMIVCSSDDKIDMRKFKYYFGREAELLEDQYVENRLGHVVGGVCPFNLPKDCLVYLDMSLRRFEYVYPAAGSRDSVIALTPNEIFIHSAAEKWVYICKGSDEFSRESFYLDQYK